MLQLSREGRVIDVVKVRLGTIHDISLGGGGGGQWGEFFFGGVPGFQRERTGISRRQQGNNVSRAFITKTFFSLFFFLLMLIWYGSGAEARQFFLRLILE